MGLLNTRTYNWGASPCSYQACLRGIQPTNTGIQNNSINICTFLLCRTSGNQKRPTTSCKWYFEINVRYVGKCVSVPMIYYGLSRLQIMQIALSRNGNSWVLRKGHNRVYFNPQLIRVSLDLCKWLHGQRARQNTIQQKVFFIMLY